MKIDPKFYLKTVLALTLAFLISQFLINNILFPTFPALRPNFKIRIAQTIKNLPTAISRKIESVKITFLKIPERLLTKNPNLPPPYQKKPPSTNPPFFIPPTSPAQPTKKSSPSQIPTLTQPSPTPQSTKPTSPYKPPPSLTPRPQPSATPLPPQPSATPTSAIQHAPAPNQQIARLLELINNERQNQGIHALYLEIHLMKAAQDYANVINSCSHYADGSDPFTRMRNAGYQGLGGGENIACGTDSPDRAFQMWMGSAGHKSNMLNPQWRSAGIGFSRGYWVLDLGPI